MTGFDGYLGLPGWRWLFIIEALPALVLAFVAWFWLVDRPAQARWLSEEEKARVARDLAEDDTRKQGHSHISFRPVLRDPRIYALGLLAIAINGGTGGTFFWLPTIIHQSGIQSIFLVGLVSTLPFLAGVLAQLGVAHHSDRTGERRWHVATCALLAAAGWGLMPLFHDHPALTIATLALVAMGTFGAMGPFWSLPASLLTGPAAAAGIALVTTIGALGSFVSPIIVGWLNDRTGYLAAGQLYYCGLMLAGALSFILLGPRDGRGPLREHGAAGNADAGGER